MKLKIALSVGLVIIVSILYFIMHNFSNDISLVQQSDVKKEIEVKDGNNVSVENGVQFVSVIVKDGYSPKKTIAQGGLPTIFSMKTDRTYDCSTSLVIKALNVKRVLPSTDVTFIDAGVPKSGDQIQGVCSMGMYSFSVEFK